MEVLFVVAGCAPSYCCCIPFAAVLSTAMTGFMRSACLWLMFCVVSDAVALTNPLVEPGVQIKVRLPKGPVPLIEGDRSRITQVGFIRNGHRLIVCGVFIHTAYLCD